jgi:hypothetical protein
MRASRSWTTPSRSIPFTKYGTLVLCGVTTGVARCLPSSRSASPTMPGPSAPYMTLVGGRATNRAAVSRSGRPSTRPTHRSAITCALRSPCPGGTRPKWPSAKSTSPFSSAATGGSNAHLRQSTVTPVTNPEHVEVVQAVFAEANRLHLPIVVQVQNEAGYGTRDAQIFLTEVPPRAPDVVVQLAHMAGSGADAIARRDPRTARLYFDVATNAEGQSYARLALLAKRIREIGTDHILHGSDASFGKHLTPRQEWATFQGYVPLAPVEIAAIANNIAPYLR